MTNFTGNVKPPVQFPFQPRGHLRADRLDQDDAFGRDHERGHVVVHAREVHIAGELADLLALVLRLLVELALLRASRRGQTQRRRQPTRRRRIDGSRPILSNPLMALLKQPNLLRRDRACAPAVARGASHARDVGAGIPHERQIARRQTPAQGDEQTGLVHAAHEAGERVRVQQAAQGRARSCRRYRAARRRRLPARPLPRGRTARARAHDPRPRTRRPRHRTCDLRIRRHARREPRPLSARRPVRRSRYPQTRL